MKNRYLKPIPILLLFVFWISKPLVAQQGITPEDYYKTIFVSQTEISPDGNYVAFTRTTIDVENNKRHREVWMQKLNNGQPDGEPFRFTDPTVESSNPQWSPDGKLLGIQSRRGDDDNSVRFIRVTAPGGEAFTIEGLDSSPIWSPDGSTVAFVKEPESEVEQEDRAGWIAPDAITNTLDAERFDGRVITQMRYKSDGTTAWLPHPSINKKRQLNIVSADGGEAEQITELEFNVGDIEWSPDGNRIYFSGDPLEDDEYNEDFTRNIYRVDLESNEVTQVFEMEGTQRSPVISPNARYMAYLQSDERGAQTDIMFTALNRNGEPTGSVTNLTAN